MKDDDKKRVLWLLLAFLVLVMLLLAFCSRDRNESVPSGLIQDPNQLMSLTEQAEEIDQSTPETLATSMAERTLEPTPRMCTHRFFPVTVGATWDYRLYSINRGGDNSDGEEVGVFRQRIDEVTTEYSAGLYWNIAIDPTQWFQQLNYECDSFGMHVSIGPNSFFYLPYELFPGMSWQDEQEYYPVQYQAAEETTTVSVPAGTFEVLCITKTYLYETSPPPFNYLVACFAEGVGEVTEEWWGNNDLEDLRWELLSYSIPTE